MISAHELEAFAAVAAERSFSKAAVRVSVTQPALSQRIQNLERALGQTLFIRDRREARLTEAGARLLRYRRAQKHLEDEVLEDLGGAADGELGGRLRVSGYSTVLSSVVLPSLAPLLRAHPRVRFEFSARETRELPGALERGEADFIVLDRRLGRAAVEEEVLGRETCVLVSSARVQAPEVYLDHDPEDRTTELFLKRSGRPAARLRRAYLDDIQGILAGVALGLGRAVVPRHLLTPGLGARVLPGYRSWDIPVVLHYFKQPYYSRLQREAVESLRRTAPGILAASRAGRQETRA